VVTWAETTSIAAYGSFGITVAGQRAKCPVAGADIPRWYATKFIDRYDRAMFNNHYDRDGAMAEAQGVVTLT
jgi:hypothetical protein